MPSSVNMPLELFQKWIDGQNPFQDNLSVLLICAVGEKSRYYAGYLRSLGCNAYNLTGGIMTWKDLQA
jgi:rhodanese-related sulfurtransferase